MESHYCWVNYCCYDDQCHNAGSGLRCNFISAEGRMFCQKCIHDGLDSSQIENETEFLKGKRWEKIDGRIN